MNDEVKEKETRVRRRGNGEGTISQRADGNWVGQITIGIDPFTCKQIRKSIVRKSRQEVSEELKKLLADKQKGKVVANNKMTVEKLMNDWLESKKVNLKQTTLDSYKNTIDIHIIPKIGKIEIQKLDASKIQKQIVTDMMDKNTFSSRTIDYTLYVLSYGLKFAIKKNLLVNNPCTDVIRPKQNKKDIVVLTPDELSKFKETIKDYYLETAFLLQIYTGIRKGECLGLDWQNVHLDEPIPYISIKKHLVSTNKGMVLDTPKTTSSIRDIPLTADLADRLRKLKGDKKKGIVFTTSTGNYIHGRSYQRSFDYILEKAGLIVEGNPKPRIHDLRHGFATQLIKNSVDLKTTSILLGHSNVKFTANCYVHPQLESKVSAIQSLL